MHFGRLVVLLLILIAGCSGSQPSTSSHPSPVSPLLRSLTPRAPTLSPQGTAPASSPLERPTPTIAPAVSRAIADLSGRLEVDPEGIQLVRVIQKEMPIQFLGCPPGGKDPQVTQPGLVIGEEIVLSFEGTEHVYHVHGRQTVYCGQR